jgi:selenocysteine lyase/cysteine desulfurase
MSGDIRKFEEIGTHPAANFLGVGDALTFHEGIGPTLKQERLIYLRDYWVRRLTVTDSVRLHTSLKPGFACGIATMQIEGMSPLALSDWLWTKHRIITTAIVHQQFEGLRITPSVYTTLQELDRFCDAIEDVISYGLPAA